MGFYKDKKIIPELVKDEKRFDEVVDNGEELLEIHLLMNVSDQESIKIYIDVKEKIRIITSNYGFRGNNMKKKYGFKGKYCTTCDSVWEVTTTTGEAGRLVRYPDFPSYGLEKQECSTCVQSSLDTEPSSPAQKIIAERQKLFNKNIKKQRK